jgi:hypothetical protein
MIRKTILMAGILLITLCVTAVQAEIVRNTAYGGGADTFISNDSQNSTFYPSVNHGAEQVFQFRNNSASRLRIAYLRFDLAEVTGSMTGATLSMTAITLKQAKTVSIYGLTDETLDSWDESTICYNNAPGMLPPTPAYGLYTIDPTKLTLLGTMDIPAVVTTPPNYPQVLTSNTTSLGVNFSNFLGADTNKKVTLVFIDGDCEASFATKENTVTPPYLRPTLTLPNASLGGAVDPQPGNNSTVNRSTTTQLSWSLITGLGIGKCDVYLGTEPNMLTMKKLSFTPAVTSVNINSFAGYSTPLAEGKYYWRVDCYNGNPLPAEPNLPGSFWSFNATSAPVITQQTSPAYQSKFPTETAVFTVGFSGGTIIYAWYKSVDNANNTDADDTYVGTNSSTLTLSNVTTANAGYYYCKATNPAETRSNPARLSIKRLYAHWALDGNANDSSGNALHGTLFGAPVFDAGVNGTTGQAMVFDGTDDYIIEPNSPGNFSDFAPGVTLSVWAKPTAVANWARFIDFGNVNTVETVLVYSDIIYLGRNGTTTSLSFTAYTGAAGTTAGITVTATNAITLNEWQMFVATMNESGSIVLYKNGLPIGTGTSASQPSVATRTRNNVGRSNWATDSLYAGSMDDIYLYNYAISADDVADMYSAVVGNFCRTKPDIDWDGSCKVDLGDFAIFAARWMECGLYPNCP